MHTQKRMIYENKLFANTRKLPFKLNNQKSIPGSAERRFTEVCLTLTEILSLYILDKVTQSRICVLTKNFFEGKSENRRGYELPVAELFVAVLLSVFSTLTKYR